MANKKQVWFRGNKANQKWTTEEVEEIFLDVYNYLLQNKDVCLLTEIEQYLLEKHAVLDCTFQKWHSQVHKDNISIISAWRLITKLLENRVVKDKEQLRPTAQSLIMQTRHGFHQKQDIESSGIITHQLIITNVDASGNRKEVKL